MISALGNILIDKIKDLSFIDKYAGVVRVIKMKSTEGKIISFPADCKTTFDECSKGKRYLDLCPDSSKKSLVYLEDTTGLRQIKKEGAIQSYNAQLNLIGWLNLPKLGVEECSYSALAIAAILKKLSIPRFNDGIFHYIDIKIIGQQPKTLDPFSKYNYDETINQYLMYPYDYFVLALDVDFNFDTRCLKDAMLNEPLNCILT